MILSSRVGALLHVSQRRDVKRKARVECHEHIETSKSRRKRLLSCGIIAVESLDEEMNCHYFRLCRTHLYKDNSHPLVVTVVHVARS